MDRTIANKLILVGIALMIGAVVFVVSTAPQPEGSLQEMRAKYINGEEGYKASVELRSRYISRCLFQGRPKGVGKGCAGEGNLPYVLFGGLALVGIGVIFRKSKKA